MSQSSTTGKSHLVPSLYCVYLLRSQPKPSTFYIGSSPDPVRRLRQHNGHLTSGAYRTKRQGTRPWDMIMVVYGFPNKITALQFEHAWQHSYQTRHIPSSRRIVNSKTGGRSLGHKVGNVRLLLNSGFFKGMGLKVMCFDEACYEAFVHNKFKIKLRDEQGVLIEYVKYNRNPHHGNLKDVEDFKEKCRRRNELLMAKFSKVLQYGEYDCVHCDDKIDYINSDEFPYIGICYHSDCQGIYHLMCMYKEFKKQEMTPLLFSQNNQQSQRDESVNFNAIIPQKGKCFRCQRTLQWCEIAKYSTWIREKIGLRGVDVDVDVAESQVDLNGEDEEE